MMYAATGDLMELLVVLFIIGGSIVSKIVEWLKKRQLEKAKREVRPVPAAVTPAEAEPPPAEPQPKGSSLEEMMKKLMLPPEAQEAPPKPVRKKKRKKEQPVVVEAAPPPPPPPAPIAASEPMSVSPPLIAVRKTPALSLDARIFRNRSLTPIQRAVILADVFGAPSALRDSRPYEFRSTL